MKKMMAMLLASVMAAGTFTTTAFAYTGEILPRLRGKDTPQTESPKREKQAFTDKNNYIASTANEYPFARNARASHRERGHFACWDSPKPLYDRERT